VNSGRLLVVDDDEMNLEIIRRRLSRLGFDVVVSTDGSHAFARVEQADIDLVLLDIEMPGLTGLQLLQRVRTKYSQADLPIIIVSSKSESETVVEALSLGANDYVTKPVDLAIMCARINAQLLRRSEGTEARTNPLSGLPNKAGLAHWWTHRLEQDVPVAVLAINLDRFRVVNNGLGRERGDQVLADVGRRLRRRAPAGSFLGHPHGDEFVAIIDDLSGDQALGVAAELLEEINQPFAAPEIPVTITGSIGITFGDATRTLDELLGEADAALYRAKTQSGGRALVFQAEFRSRAAERLRLETELQDTVSNQAISLDFQPIVTLENGTVAGFEALARWRHPTRGEVPPSAFIPLAEETGLILSLGHQVLQLACRQLREWQRNGVLSPGGCLSVNVSAAQLHDPRWIDTLHALITETGVDPAGLKIEITEGMLLQDLEHAGRLFTELRGFGVQVALDDFGTGYSSLSYLQHLAIDWIKIDRSFVDQLAEITRKSRIVQSVIDLARRLEIDVVAEGIETERDFNWLRIMGCRFGQGYFISRPLPAAAAADFARRQAAAADVASRTPA
jgi:diguanylate cyclase (GGDEF)-like protein